MIGQMTVLLRLRRLKEEQALRAVQAKRREVADGEAALVAARRTVSESVATMPAREDAIYRAIIGTVVDPDRLDDTRGRVVALQQGHKRLEDAEERAGYVLHRLETELQASVDHHRRAMRMTEKYTVVRTDLVEQADAAATLAEENEVEEMFTGRKREVA